MERLSSKTVFHEIDLKKKSDDEDSESENEVILPGPDWEEIDKAGDAQTPPQVDSDEEWDTDLETESYETRRYTGDDQVRQVYLASCRQLNIVPAHCFLKAIKTDAINLSFQGLGPAGTRAVATALVIDTVTSNLDLACNFIGHEGIRNVCEMLKENEFITHLDLSENDLDTYAAQVIFDVFKVNDSVTHLNLSGNNFKDHDAEFFARMLNVGRFTGLRDLDLSHNHLGDIGAQIIGHAIGDNETLTHLNLSWNEIRRPGIDCIAKGLSENNCLRVLDLSSNGVDNQGADSIGKALLNNSYLTDLNLSSNRVGLDGIAVLFKSIGKNDCLQIIRLTNNPITLQGPVAALKLLQQSDTSVLQELEIADACAPREFYDTLEEVQATRPNFKVIIGGFMNARDMCKADAKTQTEAWKKDPILVFINFIENKKMKVVDMFKEFDKDKSCTLTRDEFKLGLTRVGCPLTDTELTQLLNVLDVDRNGEIDIGEFMDGFDKHKRRLTKYSKYGSLSRPGSSVSRTPSRPSSKTSTRPPSSSRPLSQNTDRPSSQNKDEPQSQISSRPPSQNGSRPLSQIANGPQSPYDSSPSSQMSRPGSGFTSQGPSSRPASSSEQGGRSTMADADGEEFQRQRNKEEKMYLEPPSQSFTLHASYTHAPDNPDVTLHVPKSLTVS